MKKTENIKNLETVRESHTLVNNCRGVFGGNTENNKINTVKLGFMSARGITLITLVITIIILLILAGVTINLTLGDNGLFKVAKQAKQQYLNAQISEEEELNELYNQLSGNDLPENTTLYAETQVDYTEVVSEEKFNTNFIVENENGLEYIELPDITIDCNDKTEISFDRTLDEGDIFKFYVKIKEKEEKELYIYIASSKPKISKIETADDDMNNISITSLENDNIITYYSLDDGETWKLYTNEISVEKYKYLEFYAKLVYNEGKTINKPRLIKYYYYLYNQGDECTAVTGGYTFNEIENKTISYAYNSDNIYMYACSITGSGHGDIELYSNNAINIDAYSKINFDVDYYVEYGQESWRNHFYYGLSGANVMDVRWNK